MASYLESVESYRLNPDRRRVFQNLNPLVRDAREAIMLADFLAKMPWTYVREVPQDIIAAHWKLLRNQPEYDEIGEDESYTLHHAACESWIGALSLNHLPGDLRVLSNNEFSPLQRVFSHENGKFAIAVAYHRNETAKKGYPLDPPTWTGTFRRTTLNNRKQSSSISFDADAREFSTVFRIEVFNSPQTTVLRKICEILQRHQLMPSSLDLWSTSDGWTGSRKIKERHSLEIEVRDCLEAEIIQSVKDDVFRYLVALLKIHSLFDIIGPAMIGPSSSHTAGACRIGQLGRNILIALEEAGHFKKIESFEIKLFGSFRDTGPGHGTHIALGAGLKGLPPDSPSLKSEGAIEVLQADGIPWRKKGEKIPFKGFLAATPEEDRKYIRQQGDCINIAEIIAHTDEGDFTVAGFSTGGGIVEVRFINNSRLVPNISGKRDLWIAPPPLATKLNLSQTAIKGKSGKIARIYPQKAPHDEFTLVFNTFDEALEYAKETGKSLLTLALELESKLQGTDEKQIIDNMTELWKIMKESVHEGLSNTHLSTMGLSGGDSTKLLNYIKRANYVSFHTLASVYALASAETNAQMGRIVACPTAGACGIIPGVLLAWHDVHIELGFKPEELERKVVEALLVAAFIGMIFYDDIPTAGATLGCQAEIGICAAMAAAAVVQLHDGSPEEVVHGAILTIKNCMGLVCDPVAGLVEVPCIKRNAMFSNFAITAADMSLAGIRSQVPPDQVVLAVKEVGEHMSANYKETAHGGLAATLNGKDVARRFDEMCRGIFCKSCGLCGE
ncbi:MAG: L-serine ammonia-lyase, iron-sulfur-dependent, subunit alpha [Proteobacteria bacterium]|nr:L-serine ammonia-lyase, iron-sulfur-dependent, subunit alpha [Pseudomonadota bacterium]